MLRCLWLVRFVCAFALTASFGGMANAQTPLLSSGRGVATTTWTHPQPVETFPFNNRVSVSDETSLPDALAPARDALFFYAQPNLPHHLSDTGVSSVPEPSVLVSVISLGFVIGVGLLRGQRRPASF